MVSERIFLGVDLGAAADGIDAAIVTVTGRGERMKIARARGWHGTLREEVRERLRATADPRWPGKAPAPCAAEVGALDRDIGVELAAAAKRAAADAQMPIQDVAAIGCGGPVIGWAEPRGAAAGACIELGCAAAVAGATGRAAVGEFVRGDLAAGGLGLPQAWVHWLGLKDSRVSRAVVDLGAISTLTFIGADAVESDVIGLVTGPGTALIDASARSGLGAAFDDDGRAAAAGSVCLPLLNELQAQDYFQRPGPKMAEACQWGELFAQRLGLMAAKHDCRKATDVIATVTELTARTVAAAVLSQTERPHQVVLCGGGSLNIALAGRIRNLLVPCGTISAEKLDLPARAVGAVCWAVLAAARMDEAAIVTPGPSGATRPHRVGGIFLG